MFLAVPGDLTAPTGGYEYARRLLRLLPDLSYLSLPDGFPLPSDTALAEAADRLAAVTADATVIIDGLAFGALPVQVLDRVRARIVALVHHPLCLETGLSLAHRSALKASERSALARAARVVTTSADTAALVARMFDVPKERIRVVEPGTDSADPAPRRGVPPHLLAVGAVVPRKGYDVLLRALSGLTALPWRLTIAGALDRDAGYADRMRSLAAALPGRIVLAGAVSDAELRQLYAGADVFVSAALYEGYGMAVASAMAFGLPIIAALGGALADTVPAASALACRPGDEAGLAVALSRMLTEPATRDACAAASLAAGRRLPTWEQAARRFQEAALGR